MYIRAFYEWYNEFYKTKNQEKKGRKMLNEKYVVNIPQFANTQVSIHEYGAVANKMDIEIGRQNANAIQKAIVELSQKGGGTVVVPAGIWACAPIRLMSGVNLHLENQAVLKFTKSKEDYPLIITNYEGQECIRTVSPISAEGAENIAITGDGLIDGSGDEWRPVKKFKMTDKQWQALLKKSDYVLQTKETEIWMPTQTIFEGNEKNIQGTTKEALEIAAEYYDFYRPVMISLRHCKNILLQNVTFTNSPAWNIHPFFCENLTVEYVKIENPYYAQNGDGIDVESCTNVHIHHTTFKTGDDAICLKAGKNAVARQIEGPCTNIHIHDCLVQEGHGGFVIGSEMSRGVRDVLVENCTFMGTDVGVRMKSALGRGGVVENITVRGINMVNIKEQAIILTMSYVLNTLNRNESISMVDEADVPFFKNITMEEITCLGCKEFVKIEPLADRADTIVNVTVNGNRLC